MSQMVSLTATSESRVTDEPMKHRAVIQHSGFGWWVSGWDFRTRYEAEEASRLRLMQVLDDLRSGVTPTVLSAVCAACQGPVSGEQMLGGDA